MRWDDSLEPRSASEVANSGHEEQSGEGEACEK